MVMRTRRRVMGSLVAACAVPLCACVQDSGNRTAPAKPRAEPEPQFDAPPQPVTRLEPWDPVDASFTGCVGG